MGNAKGRKAQRRKGVCYPSLRLPSLCVSHSWSDAKLDKFGCLFLEAFQIIPQPFHTTSFKRRAVKSLRILLNLLQSRQV